MGKSAAATKDKRYSAEEYLAMERATKRRHEYVDGEIVAMGGASVKHNLIVSNLMVEIGIQLKNSKCRAFAADMRVKAKHNYFYPDIVVSCLENKFEDPTEETLLNPRVIIEVLSRSTKLKDRNLKFDAYLSLESITDYLLVEQNSMRVEHYQRQGDVWNVSVYASLTDLIKFRSINAEISIEDIYRSF